MRVRQSRGLWRGQAVGSVFEYAVHLFAQDAWEPLQKFLDGSPALEIREQRGYRHAGPAKHPSAAHSPGVSFHYSASGPIEHALSLDRLSRMWPRLRVVNALREVNRNCEPDA